MTEISPNMPLIYQAGIMQARFKRNFDKADHRKPWNISESLFPQVRLGYADKYEPQGSDPKYNFNIISENGYY